MNGTMYSQDPSIGFYTGNGPISTSYQSQYPSTFTPTMHLHQLITSNRLPMQSNNHFNQYEQNVQHSFYPNDQQQSANGNVYHFENGASMSADYYNRVHGQIRSNTPATYPHSDTYPPPPPSSNLSRQPTPATINGQSEPTFLVVSGVDTSRSSPPTQVIEKFRFHQFSIILFFSLDHLLSLQSHYMILNFQLFKDQLILIHHLINSIIPWILSFNV